MKSLRGQLTLRLLLGGALLFGTTGVALHWRLRAALTLEFGTSLRTTLQTLVTHTDQKAGGVKIEKGGATLPQFDEPDDSDVFLLSAADGAEIQRSRSLGLAPLPARAGPPGTTVFFNTTLPGGRALRCAALRLVPPMAKKAREQNMPEVEVVLTVGRDRGPLDRTLDVLQVALALIGAMVLVRWGVRGGLAPLERLGVTVSRLDAASLAAEQTANCRRLFGGKIIPTPIWMRLPWRRRRET